jgi:flagellar biosynthetic protein FlhB
LAESAEHTEAPTPQRRREAREEGNVARSADLTAAISLLGAVLLLGFFADDLFRAFKVLVHRELSTNWISDGFATYELSHTLATSFWIGIKVFAPLAIAMFAIGVVANIFQIGFLVSLKAVAPKLSKLDPSKGIKNIIGKRAMMRLVMSLAKVSIVTIVSAVFIYLEVPRVLSLARIDAMPLLAAAAAMVWALSLKIAVVLLLLAILDFMYQKWQHEDDLKMTKQQVKEDMKRMEGDPQTKQRRAKVARQLAMQRMGQVVPSADVVVTNPTHYSIALKYDETTAAPKVVAKGVDFMAMRIRQLAVANGVPIVERPPLARGLYRHVDVGQEIPTKYYKAVAEILAYVYQLDRTRRRSA